MAVAFALTLRAFLVSPSKSPTAILLRPVMMTGGTDTLPREACTESPWSVRTTAEILDELPAICIFVHA